MRIAVIDGQGGGMGKTIVEKLRLEFGHNLEILALGTNALATALMLKAGANEGASGENAITYNSPRVDVIIGPIGIIAANSMLGELTPTIAKAIAESPAKKILIPMNKCNIQIAGVKNEPLPHQVDNAIMLLREYMR
jgi:NAD(P)-dependent dehydrogenase (short-subunit alcohol dehydrogenase family)